MAAGRREGKGHEPDLGSRLSVPRKCADLINLSRRGRWVVVVVLAVLVSLFEAVAALLVYALLAMVTGSHSTVALPIVGDVRELFPGLEDTSFFIVVALGIAAFFVGRAGFVVVQSYVQGRVVENAGATLASRLFMGYLTMPYVEHLRRNSSELVRNTYDNVRGLARDVFQPGVAAASEGLIVLGVLTVLVATAPMATLLAVAVLGPTVYLLLRIIHPRLTRLGNTYQDMSKDNVQFLQQCLHGIRDIKVLGCWPYFHREFAASRRRWARTCYLRSTLRSIPRVLMETVLVIFIVILFGVTVVMEGGAVATLPVLGLFAYAALRLKPALQTIVASLNSIKFASPAIHHVHGDLLIAEEAAVRRATEGPEEPVGLAERIVLENVAFRYPGTSVDVLTDINLAVARGEAVGIVGTTGSGKTTLLDIVMGLLDPTAGAVKVDGVDIRTRRQGWQRSLGVVPQMVFLVDDTLQRNIALGMKDEDIDEARIGEVVRMAQLEDVVAALPDGLETVVGERGLRMSGGQRQRIAIARALYHDPAVLLFDEGTSALDGQTEGELLEALGALRRTRTILIVAHRLTTVRDCDRIIVLSGGQIVDSGRYDDLIARNTEFRALAGAG